MRGSEGNEGICAYFKIISIVLYNLAVVGLIYDYYFPSHQDSVQHFVDMLLQHNWKRKKLVNLFSIVFLWVL